jgi:hypothetical protein
MRRRSSDDERLEANSRCLRPDAQALPAGAPVGEQASVHCLLGSESGYDESWSSPGPHLAPAAAASHRESEQTGV